MQLKEMLKKAWPYLVAMVVFVVVSCVYMSPVLDGKVIASTDGVQGTAAVHEAVTYHEQTGDVSWWTGSMFSGMPNYQVGGYHYEADRWLRPLRYVLLAGHRNVIAIVLIYCLAFFALLRSVKVDKWLSIVGALAIAFSSYFFIIIGANHHGKTSTLALMSLALAGFYLIFNGHRKTGVVLSMIGTMAGFYPHPQMAYYLCFIFAAMGVAELCRAIISRQWRAFCLNVLLALGALGVGVGTGASATFANLEYAQETMRGGHSDLVKASDADNKTQGLDLDYATAWSYGIDECWTFLVPDYMGGSSHYPLGRDSEIFQKMVKQGIPRRSAEQFCQALPTYWGEQPFTAGPVYMGVLVCLLFVLSLFVVRGPYKWALLAVTLLSVMLSWGSHWMDLTRFFFEHVPMYNKFRAVSSILVIAEITMPLSGFMALQRLVEVKHEGETAAVRRMLHNLLLAGGIVLALLLTVLGCTDSFKSPNDAAMFAQLPDWISEAIVAQRQAMFSADVWRGVLLLSLAVALLWGYLRSAKFKTWMLAVALGVLVLGDMWPVNQRYMNDAMFSKPAAYDDFFQMQPYEQQIEQWEGALDDDSKSYRVMNLSANTFNDARTSYRLKSLGGYSAAKLRRYQDIINQHLSQMHWPVINMLNARYIIVPGQDGAAAHAQYNKDAMGNAWYVHDLQVVSSPNEECDGLMRVDLHTTALVGPDFADCVPGYALVPDSAAQVTLTHYSPNAIDYEATSAHDGTIVFSEVYYPYGWKATVDGQPVPHYRVNYLLRALNVPAGQHHICFEFQPEATAKGNVVAMCFVALMYLVILVVIGMGIYKSCKKS